MESTQASEDEIHAPKPAEPVARSHQSAPSEAASTRPLKRSEIILARIRAGLPIHDDPNTAFRVSEVDRLLEQDMRHDNHSAWGFVIYRCTYDSDEQWSRMLEMLESQNNLVSHRTGKPYLPPFLLNSLRITVFEDKDTLNGLDVASVRQKFREWLATNPEEHEQSSESVGKGRSPRYKFCLMIDAAALSAILTKPPGLLARLRDGAFRDCNYVNLIVDSTECFQDDKQY